VFGCGHPDWVATFHAIPTLIDHRLAECGAERLCKRGEGNAAAAELFDQFDDWEADFLDTIGTSASTSSEPTLTAEIDRDIRKNLLQQEFMRSITILANDVISKGDVEIKRRIRLELPKEMQYRAGDYIGLLPVNPLPVVQRALIRFALHADDVITLKGSGGAYTLPMNMPISAFDLLGGFVELEQPASLKQVERLKQYVEEESPDGQTLKHYCEANVYEKELAGKRVDLLSLLEELTDVEMPFTEFLASLPSIRMRQVSRKTQAYSHPYVGANTATISIQSLLLPLTFPIKPS
jgi:cytochrome P450/NADPH-cytochrome P450 reductase